LRLLLVLKLRRKRQQRRRALYIRPIVSNRIVQGELSLVQELAEDPHYHHRYFRKPSNSYYNSLRTILSMAKTTPDL
ncbi:unnamed protein product, partial [Allacma fusca]